MSQRRSRRSLLAAAGAALAGLSGCLQLSGDTTEDPPAATQPGFTTTPTRSPTPSATPTPRDTDGDGVPNDEDYAPRDPDVQSAEDLTDSPTQSPSPTDSPTATPTQTARPFFTDGFERGTANWALEPLASEGASVTVTDTGGYENTRGLRWEFTAAETTAYAATRKPVVAPGQTLTVLARLPELPRRSPSVSLAGAGVFGTDGPGGLLQFGYSGWDDRLFAEANNANTLGRRGGDGVLTSGGWLEFRIEWPATDRLRLSVRDLQTDSRTPTLSVTQSALDSPAEVGLSVYNSAAGDPAYFDRVAVE